MSNTFWTIETKEDEDKAHFVLDVDLGEPEGIVSYGMSKNVYDAIVNDAMQDFLNKAIKYALDNLEKKEIANVL